MKSKIPLLDARKTAEEIVAFLSPACSRIEIAGSIRREKQEVGDIELVAIPLLDEDKDLFGERIGTISPLDYVDFRPIGRVLKGGSKYKQIELTSGINLDLFIVTHPAQWGVIFMIRTGSADFSHKMVTIKRFGGCLPSDCSVRDGAVWRNGQIVPMPEEDDYFTLCDIPVIPPDKRL